MIVIVVLFKANFIQLNGHTIIVITFTLFRSFFTVANQKEKIGHLACQRMTDYSKGVGLIPNSSPVPFDIGMSRTVKRSMLVAAFCLPVFTDIFLIGTMLTEHSDQAGAASFIDVNKEKGDA